MADVLAPPPAREHTPSDAPPPPPPQPRAASTTYAEMQHVTLSPGAAGGLGPHHTRGRSGRVSSVPPPPPPDDDDDGMFDTLLGPPAGVLGQQGHRASIPLPPPPGPTGSYSFAIPPEESKQPSESSSPGANGAESAAAPSHVKLPSAEFGAKPGRQVPSTPGSAHSSKPSRGVPSVPPSDDATSAKATSPSSNSTSAKSTSKSSTSMKNMPAVEISPKIAPKSTPTSPKSENDVIYDELFGTPDPVRKMNPGRSPPPPLKKAMSFKLSMKSFAQWRKTKKDAKPAASKSMKNIPTGGQAMPVPIPSKSPLSPRGKRKPDDSSKSPKSRDGSKSPRSSGKNGGGGHHRAASSTGGSSSGGGWLSAAKKAKVVEAVPTSASSQQSGDGGSQSVDSYSLQPPKMKENGGGGSSPVSPSPSSSPPPSTTSSEFDGEGRHVRSLTVEDAREMTEKALLYACLHSEQAAEDVTAFLKSGANPNYQDEAGVSPLHFAAQTGDSEVVSLLLQGGANPLLQTKDKSESPLHIAAREGFLNVVELFLAIPPATCEVLLDLTDSDGKTALCTSAAENQVEVVAELLHAGARCEHKTKRSLTALDIAIRKGFVEVASELLSAGAEVRPVGHLNLLDFDQMLETLPQADNQELDRTITSTDGHQRILQMLLARGYGKEEIKSMAKNLGVAYTEKENPASDFCSECGLAREDDGGFCGECGYRFPMDANAPSMPPIRAPAPPMADDLSDDDSSDSGLSPFMSQTMIAKQNADDLHRESDSMSASANGGVRTTSLLDYMPLNGVQGKKKAQPQPPAPARPRPKSKPRRQPTAVCRPSVEDDLFGDLPTFEVIQQAVHRASVVLERKELAVQAAKIVAAQRKSDAALQKDPQAASSSGPNLGLKGWLWKRSPGGILKNKTWLKRFCYTTGVEILYFKNQDDKHARGSVPLAIITKVAIADRSPRGCCFEISTSLPNGRKFEFRATNRIVCEQWVDRLNSAAVYFAKLPHFDARAKVPLSPGPGPVATGASSARKDVAMLPKIKTASTMSKTVNEDAAASATPNAPSSTSSDDGDLMPTGAPPSDSEFSFGV